VDPIKHDDLVAELNVLLEAERAGARVGANLVQEAAGGTFEALAKTIQADEVRWARALFEAVSELGAAPSEKVGDFYGKALAVEGLEARLAFTNRGQGWVVRKLRELIPRIENPKLVATLQAMLDAHVTNIADANAALERAHATP
jgi:nitronate monooxygenase